MANKPYDGVMTFSQFSNSQIIEILDEHYYAIGATGRGAFVTLLEDFSRGAFRELHDLDDARMVEILADMAVLLAPNWDVLIGGRN